MRNVYIAPILAAVAAVLFLFATFVTPGDRPGAGIQSPTRRRRQTQLERRLAGVQRGQLGHRASRRRAGSPCPDGCDRRDPSRHGRCRRWRHPLPALGAGKEEGELSRIGCRWIPRPGVICRWVPRATYMPHPFQIVQNAKHSLYLSEYAGAVRTIFMEDPGPAPADSWMGWSVGKWDGDTLVVDAHELRRSEPGSTGPGTSTATRCTSSSDTRRRAPIISFMKRPSRTRKSSHVRGKSACR